MFAIEHLYYYIVGHTSMELCETYASLSCYRHEVLERALAAPDTTVLFPSKVGMVRININVVTCMVSPLAVDLFSLPQQPLCAHGAALIVIDGTWSQAKGLFYHNDFLHKLRQVAFVCARVCVCACLCTCVCT